MEFFRHGRAQENNQQNNNSLWMIIYTDMITNLMIFFLMLYGLTWLSENDRAIAAASFREAFAGEKGQVQQVMENIQKGLEKKKSIEKEVKKQFKDVEISERRIKIILPSPVLFDSGSAVLKPSTQQSLHEIANIVRAMNCKVIVEGHTDNVPITGGQYDSNWELSSARAFSVIQYLTDREGLSPLLLSALGYGEFRPKAANDTEANKAVNRRIEINLIKPKG